MNLPIGRMKQQNDGAEASSKSSRASFPQILLIGAINTIQQFIVISITSTLSTSLLVVDLKIRYIGEFNWPAGKRLYKLTISGERL